MVTSTLALALTAVTLAVFAALGAWYARGRVGSVEDFITARDSAGAGTLTATLVASSMGAWILFSPAEAGAAFGGITSVLGYAAGSATPLIVFAYLGPRIRRAIPDGHSITEYAYARYGNAMYAYVLCISIAYMFVFLAAEMTGITGALSLVADVPAWQTAALIGGFVLAYTVYGGLQASIFTDTLQTLVLLPLLALGFGGALLALGGTGEIHRTVVQANPSLLDPGFLPGLKFGSYIVIAVLGAEMLNQAWWQRIYAGRDDATVKRAFLVSAVAVVPMIVVSGLFGLAAAGLGIVDGNASVAFFLVLNQAFPEWVTLAVTLIAVLLVMSTADTLFNAIASVVTADLPRLLDDADDSTLSLAARGLTVVVAVAATVVGAQGYSVLQLFFVADLLATATFVPLLYGLYSPEPTGSDVLAASLLGLGVGTAYFPTLRGLLTAVPGLESVLPTPTFFMTFVSAFVVSSVAAVVFARLSSSRFDLDRLRTDVRKLDEPVPDGGEVDER
jgi:Na+/proline symporter